MLGWWLTPHTVSELLPKSQFNVMYLGPAAIPTRKSSSTNLIGWRPLDKVQTVMTNKKLAGTDLLWDVFGELTFSERKSHFLWLIKSIVSQSWRLVASQSDLDQRYGTVLELGYSMVILVKINMEKARNLYKITYGQHKCYIETTRIKPRQAGKEKICNALKWQKFWYSGLYTNAWENFSYLQFPPIAT